MAHERFSTLSSGIKQKAALIISIAHDPDIIILDEPTNGLDLLAAKMIVDSQAGPYPALQAKLDPQISMRNINREVEKVEKGKKKKE
ncbi:MAG: ATP-binding cassette domain-containing protein, partial [Spirochaetales bacterium]|nr:ATP-binding cassette domain-containing protein [Spirochaetales bacterium]